MHIRTTRPGELDEVMAIYAHARQFMADHGNPRQWGPTSWPPRDLVAADIAAGKSHVCESDGRIAAVFSYDYGPDVDPCYRHIEGGSWRRDGPYGVVHRIASAHIVPGAGAACLDWAFEQCGHLRIDTHGDNVVLQGLLAKLGFSHRGTIYVREDHDPRMAFDKIG